MAVTFSNREMSHISQIVYRLKNLMTYEEVYSVLLKQLHTIIPFNSAAGIAVAEEDGKISVIDSYSYSPDGPELRPTVLAHPLYLTLWENYFMFPWSSTVRRSDIISDADWISSESYKNLLAGKDVFHCLHMVLVKDDIKLGMISLYRKRSAGDFTPKEMMIFEMLKCHIELKCFRVANRNSGFKYELNPMTPVFKLTMETAGKYHFTLRESEITKEILSGLSDKDICGKLCISKSTFDKHLHNLYKKTTVNNRSDFFQKFKI